MGLARTASAVTAALAALVLAAGPATAYPGQDDVDRARQREAAAAGDAGRIQARYAAAQARADDADTALSVAAEDYDEAVIELDASRRVATAAQAAAAAAAARVAAAQRDVGRLAAQAYRDGGGVSSLSVVFSDRGPQDVLDRASMMRSVGDRRQRTVQTFDAARVVATVMQRQAADAVARNAAAERRLAAARAEATARASAARSIAASVATEQEQLLTQLAAAQRTTVALERQRQQGLAEERARREAEAAARAEAAREAAAAAEARRKAEEERKAREAAARPAPRTPSAKAPAPPKAPAPQAPAPQRPAPKTPSGGSSSGSSSGGAAAVAWAKRQLGLPYLWGGAGPKSYDCSGLTMRAWQRSGISLPHSSRAQYRQSRKISYSALRPGDLLFFATDTSNPDSIHHVTMYAGNGMMIEAPYTGANVRLMPMRYKGRMPYAARP